MNSLKDADPFRNKTSDCITLCIGHSIDLFKDADSVKNKTSNCFKQE